MRLSEEMRVVKLTPTLEVLVPALALTSLSKSTRGLTLPPGRAGLGIGAFLVVCSLFLGYLLEGPTGPLGGLLSFWFVGTAGATTFAAALEPTAFVKPICVRCRLLPVIREHEAIHLSGVASESEVWKSMRTRHNSQSLALEGDPAICSFCPIPKRLGERQVS